MSDHTARPLAIGSPRDGAPDQLQATTGETNHDVVNDNQIQVNQDKNPEDATTSEHDISSNVDLSDFDDEDPDGSDDLVEGLAAERATWYAMNEGGLHKSKAEPSGSTTMDQPSSAAVTTVLDDKDDEDDTQDEDYQPESDEDSDEESSANSNEEEDEEAETDTPDDLVEGLAEESATWTAIVEGYRQSEAGPSGTSTATQIQVSAGTILTLTLEYINEDEEDGMQDEDYQPESGDDFNEESSDDSNDEDDSEADTESNATDALLDGLAQESATWAAMLTLKERLDEELLKPAVAQASSNQQEEAGDNNVDTDSQDEDYIPPPSVKEQDSSEGPEEVQDDTDEENDSDGDEGPVADIWNNNFLQSLTCENASWDARFDMHREETKRAALIKMLKDIPSMENTLHNASASGGISSEPEMTLDGLAAYMVSSIQTRSNFHGNAATELIAALGLSVPDFSDDESSDPTYQPDEIDSEDEYSDDEEDDGTSQDDDEMVEGLTNEIAAWNSILKRKREACSSNLNTLE